MFRKKYRQIFEYIKEKTCCCLTIHVLDISMNILLSGLIISLKI